MAACNCEIWSSSSEGKNINCKLQDINSEMRDVNLQLQEKCQDFET